VSALTTDQFLLKADQIVVNFLAQLVRQNKIDKVSQQNLIKDWKNLFNLAQNNKNELTALNEFKILLGSIDYGIFDDIPEDIKDL
jgi:hypothetical protein